MNASDNYPDPPQAWGALARGVVSLVIILYLAVVLLGPLANPVGSEELTIPLSRVASPVHQAM
ncbi:MAG: hypothetical protein VYE64_02830, partial [Planctomycetota bacterium]|nr:hypothetical protein [Planctomycetota bacterium]